MRIVGLLMLLVIFFQPGNAQFSLSGRVSDREGNQLGFASVFLQGTTYAAATEDDGHYLLKDVQKDEYVLVAKFLGYRSFQTQIYLQKDTVINIVLEGQVFGLDQIEIKGTWSKEKYPFAKTEFTQEQISDRNSASDAPYLLQYSPSVVVSSDAGTGVGYTGIRVRGVDPTRVNVTVNGIPLNDAESQSVYWVDLPDIMNSVKDVQIQRGVGTSTNGAGAFGASLHLNTNKLNLTNYANLEGVVGSYGTRKIGVEAGTGLINDQFTLDGRYSLITSDGYVDRAKSSLTSYYLSGTRLSDKQSIRFNIFSGHEITYQSWYGLPIQFLTDSTRTFNAAGIDNDFSRKNIPYDNEIDNYTQSHYQLFWNRAIGEDLKFDLAVHYTRGQGYYEQFKNDQNLQDYGLAQNTLISDLVRRKWLKNHFYGIVYNLNKTFDHSDLLIGGGLHNYSGRHFGEVDTVYDVSVEIPYHYLYYDNDAQKLDFNSYVKYTYQLGQLTIFGDMQYRLVNYRFLGKNDNGASLDQRVIHHFINPKAGLYYHFGKHTNAYASLAIANREPNRDDYIGTGVSERPDPERLVDYEAGFRVGNTNFSFGTNLYYMKYKDQLVLTGKLNDVGDYTKINIPHSYRSGVEFDLKTQVEPYVEFGAALTVSRNKISAFTEYIDDWDEWSQIAIEHVNTDISFSPGMIASAELVWHTIQSFIPETRHSLDVAFSHKMVGKQYLDNTMNEGASLAPFNYSDLTFRYRFTYSWLKNAALELQILNLLDKKYVSNGWVYRYKSAGYNPLTDDPYSVSDRDDRYNMIGLFPQATRHFMLRVRLDF